VLAELLLPLLGLDSALCSDDVGLIDSGVGDRWNDVVLDVAAGAARAKCDVSLAAAVKTLDDIDGGDDVRGGWMCTTSDCELAENARVMLATSLAVETGGGGGGDGDGGCVCVSSLPFKLAKGDVRVDENARSDMFIAIAVSVLAVGVAAARGGRDGVVDWREGFRQMDANDEVMSGVCCWAGRVCCEDSGSGSGRKGGDGGGGGIVFADRCPERRGGGSVSVLGGCGSGWFECCKGVGEYTVLTRYQKNKKQETVPPVANHPV